MVPKEEGVLLMSDELKQVGGAKFTTPLGRFTGMKIPPKKFMDEGGIVKGKNGGMVRQCKPKVRIF